MGGGRGGGEGRGGGGVRSGKGGGGVRSKGWREKKKP